MKQVKFLLLAFVFYSYYVGAERLPDFSYDYQELYLQCGMFEAEPIVFETPKTQKSAADTFEKVELPTSKPVRSEPLIRGESDLNEASSISGVAPKLVYRYEKFIKSRFYGKLYSSKDYFFYLGGFKASSWRADPRDAGVYAGSGMDF